MLVIIEIKGTDWDAIQAGRVMRNLRRHLRQLQLYLDTASEDMDAGRWDSVVAARRSGAVPLPLGAGSRPGAEIRSGGCAGPGPRGRRPSSRSTWA